MSTKSPSLRANLTRQHHGRDPRDIYEITKLLGNGSMGSVAKVRKKVSFMDESPSYLLKGSEAIVGESSTSNEEDDGGALDDNSCFNLPLVGGMFASCIKGAVHLLLDNDTLHSSGTGVSKTSDRSFTVVADDDAESSSASTFAMKSIHLQHITNAVLIEELQNEVEMLKTLDHPHIVRVLETYQHEQQLWVVMELCSGGDLYSRDPYTEAQAARICSAICAALTYMHSKGVLHRDLKYENILFVNDSPQAEVKLIDFGLSKAFVDDEHLTEGVGTIYTMAPEVLKGKYTKQADLWSVGVIAYMLLSSQMPFYGQTRKVVVQKILSGKFNFKGRRWKGISEQAKTFVDDLLVLDPDDRATANEALRAQWLNRRHGASVRNPHSEEMDSMASSIKRFVGYSKLRKVALMIVAHKSTSAEIGPSVRKFFQLYDQDGTGQMTFFKFKNALIDAGYEKENFREIFDAINMDGSGLIRYTEFLAATIEATGPVSEQRLADAFERVDHDGKGYISAGNLKYLLGNDFPMKEIHSIMSETGSNDGISYADFMAQFQGNQEAIQQNRIVQESGGIKYAPDKEGMDQLSELSSEASGSEDIARLNFIEGKSVSIRNALEVSAQSGP